MSSPDERTSSSEQGKRGRNQEKPRCTLATRTRADQTDAPKQPLKPLDERTHPSNRMHEPVRIPEQQIEHRSDQQGDDMKRHG